MIIRYFLYLLLCCICLVHNRVLASFDFNTHNTRAYQSFLKLKLAQGSLHLNQASAIDKNNGINIYLANYTDFIKLLLTENRELYEQLADKEDERLEMLEDLEESSPYYLFTQAEIRAQWAFIKFAYGEEVSAYWDIRKAYSLLKENEEKFPDFVPNKKTLGLFRIVFGSVPAKYQWIIEASGLEYDVNKGIKNLEEVAASNSVFAVEAKLMLELANNYLLNKQQLAFEQLDKLQAANSDNLMINVAFAVVALKSQKAQKAIQILEKCPQGTDYLQFAYIDYIKGQAYLNLGKYTEAYVYLKKFINGHKGENYLKDAYFRLFLCYWLTDDQKSANYYIQLVKTKGSLKIEADKNAYKFVSSTVLPHKEITRARVYFDGGENDKALDIMLKIKESTLTVLRDKIEYYYRLGRIYDMMGKTQLAVSAYEKAIALNGISAYYFAPNACLQLGYIYRDVYKNKTLAKTYFKKVSTYGDHEYKTSLDNKAKAALNTLK